MSIYDQFITKDDIVFDVGANAGDKTAVFAELVGPQGLVVAIEPQRSYYKSLIERFVFKHDLRNVRAVCKAVGEFSGQEYIRGTSTTASMSVPFIHYVQESGRFQNRWDGLELVDVITLDKLVADYGVPAFIKIDVEGYEPKVIRGLSQPVKALCFEFHPEVLYMAEQVFQHAAMLGPFTTNYAIGNNPKELELTEWVPPDRLLEYLSSRFCGNNQDMGDIFIRWENA